MSSTVRRSCPSATARSTKRPSSCWMSSLSFLPTALRSRSASARENPASTKDKKDKRSEEHTSELQSHSDLVCRLLLEKKKKKKKKNNKKNKIKQDKRS